jgi:hypothetical protein
MIARGFVLLAVASISCLGSIGCGSSQGVMVGNLVPVKGTVTYKGKLVTKGTVFVEPEAGRPAQGEIQPDGTYVLSTTKPGDGVIAGTHKVTLGIPKSIAPTRRPKSDLEIEFTADKTDYPIEIK